MTLEEVLIQKPERAQCTGEALEEVLVAAKDNDSLTVGVYESAKVMNLDPDSVSFCVLAVDEEFECDIALQIHFTLIQSFCFDNDISIVRVSDMQRLADIVGDKAEQLEDVHCVLITVRRAESGTAGVVS
uniref:Growth arrest and DNA-damage-inducible, gamma n=1 Tax=Nothobranchius furzeri TaxID=105023 RepID=A0A1A7ZI41_NOTFU